MSKISVPGTRVDPLRGYRFRVDLNVSSQAAGFTKVSGLESEFETTEYREGHDRIWKRKYPGIMSFPRVVLERGLSLDGSLQEWHEECGNPSLIGPVPSKGELQEADFRRLVAIKLYGRGNAGVKMQWHLHNAYCAKLVDGELNADSSDIPVESCEIEHEYLTRERIGVLAGTSGNVGNEYATG
jgi:phage tail-like protein